MKKRLGNLMTVLLVAICMTGCGIPVIPDMTDDEQKLVAEYAAGLLLKYDNSFTNSILTEEQLEKAKLEERIQREREEKTKRLAEEYVAKTKAAENKNGTDEAGQKNEAESEQEDNVETISANDIGGFLDIEGLNIEYNGYDTVKSYPETGNSVFSVDAANGKELILTKLSVQNTTNDTINLDMFNSGAMFYLSMSDKTTIPCSSTLLLDDFSIYKDSINSGATVNTILLFEVNEGTNLEGSYIGILDGDKQGKILLN